MKKIALKVAFFAVLALISIDSMASENQAISIDYSTTTIKVDTFKVYGNCGMCKKTIEGSLSDVEGVESSEWNKDTKMIVVKYNDEEVSLKDIKKAVAKSGYDTDEYKATDKAYKSLHGCCQYEREED